MLENGVMFESGLMFESGVMFESDVMMKTVCQSVLRCPFDQSTHSTSQTIKTDTVVFVRVSGRGRVFSVCPYILSAGKKLARGRTVFKRRRLLTYSPSFLFHSWQ